MQRGTCKMTKGYDKQLESDPENDPSRSFVAPLAWGMLILLVALVIGSIRQVYAAPVVSGQAVAKDGDSLMFDGKEYRLHGIDAFEADQKCAAGDGSHYKCGILARKHLASLVAGKTVWCAQAQKKKTRGRTVVNCTVGGLGLSNAMVLSGWALDCPRYSKGKYQAAQEAAKSKKSGAWAGKFKEPQEHKGGARYCDAR